jgi:hypothetical protein
MDKDTCIRYAVKLYIDYAFFEFVKEKSMNELLINHPNVVIANKCVSSAETGAPLVINHRTFTNYSYIVVPLYEKGTLLDLIKKAYQPNSQKLSPGAVKHFWK